MGRATWLSVAPLLLMLGACQHKVYDTSVVDPAASGRPPSVNDAIIAQHTLYPYHFVPLSPRLNELGRYDLAVLVEQFRQHPSELAIRRGETDAALYQARIDTVMKELVRAGVDVSRLAVRKDVPSELTTPPHRTQPERQERPWPLRRAPIDRIKSSSLAALY